MSSYLDLVEEHLQTSEINQFEKVLVLAERAKDLYQGKTCLVEGLEGRKPTTKAQYELVAEKIEPVISEKVDVPHDLDYDEEED